MFELVDQTPQSAVIKVIGVGGGGGNAVNHMVANNIEVLSSFVLTLMRKRCVILLRALFCNLALMSLKV